NVSASLPEGHPARERGWWNHVAVVHPVDDAARVQMLSQGYGNPFIHHLTWGLEPPPRLSDDYAYAGAMVRAMAEYRQQIGDLLSCQPGDLVLALPEDVMRRPGFRDDFTQWVSGLDPEYWQVEPMQGGGFLLQF